MKGCIYMLLIVLFCGCQQAAREKEIVQVSVLRGPSAIVFAQWMAHPPVLNGRTFVIRMIDTPDLMQATLINQHSDIAVLPMVNAANLYNKGIHYRLAGCPVWGTLYMVEKTDTPADDLSLYVFGAGANPDILTRYYLEQQGLSYELKYSFASAREIAQALHIGKIHRAILSEPFLGEALRRDTTLRIIADLNRPAGEPAGFAQTAILFAPSLMPYKNTLDSLLTVSCRFANEQPAEAIRILEAGKVFPHGMLTPESIRRCRIDYRTAADAKESIYDFLSLMYKYEPKVVGGKLPDEGFIISPGK